MSGATPNATVAIAWSTAQGPSSVPSGSCAGTPLDLATPNLLTIGTADASGSFALAATAPAVACGAFLQGVDLVDWLPTNVATVP